MFLKATILSIFIAAINAQPGDVCILHSEPTPHPTNCSKFFSCGSGKIVEMECPARLHFNADKKLCDWPASAGCEKSTNKPQDIPSSDLTTVPSPGEPCQPSLERNNPRMAADPENCGKFLLCTAVWVPMDCPAGLWFSFETGKCEHPQNAKCCPTCAKPKCTIDGELLPNPNDCQKFFICSGSSMIELTCVGDLVFNATTNECEHGAKCNSLKPPSVKENFPNCHVEGALYPNYKNCANFFICNGGTLVEQSCPPNKFFSAATRNCQPKSKAICASVVSIKKHWS